MDGKRKGVRGGGCGRPASGGLSFSITKSVATKHPVDVTSQHIACGCRPMLQLHYRRQSDGWMADAWWGVWGRGGRSDGQTCVQAGERFNLQSPLISPPLGSDSGPEYGRTGGSVHAGAHWSPTFNCTRRRRCCSTTNSSSSTL